MISINPQLDTGFRYSVGASPVMRQGLFSVTLWLRVGQGDTANWNCFARQALLVSVGRM
jgi:hypothetical protein